MHTNESDSQDSIASIDRLPDDYLGVLSDAVELERIRTAREFDREWERSSRAFAARLEDIEAYQTASGDLRILGPDDEDIQSDTAIALGDAR